MAADAFLWTNLEMSFGGPEVLDVVKKSKLWKLTKD
jgi:hypothetical protein